MNKEGIKLAWIPQSRETFAEQGLGQTTGESFHAIQDFYSHSNYVELFLVSNGGVEVDISTIPTFEEAMSDSQYEKFAELLKTDLKTGEYNEETKFQGEGSHHDLNHDVGAGSNFAIKILTNTILTEVKGKEEPTYNSRAAEELATKATVKLNDEIETKIE